MNGRELEALDRRIANLIRVGVIDTVDGDRATVSIGGVLTAPLRWATRRAGDDGDWWAPSSGEQVLVFSPSGELSSGIIAFALSSSAQPPPSTEQSVRRVRFSDGTVVEYDKGTSTLLVDAAGDVTVQAAGTVIVAGAAVKLGSSTASDPVVRRTELVTWLSGLLTSLNTGANTGGAVVWATPLPTPGDIAGASKTTAD